MRVTMSTIKTNTVREDVEQYLSQGGTITQVPSYLSGEDPTQKRNADENLERWKARTWSKRNVQA